MTRPVWDAAWAERARPALVEAFQTGQAALARSGLEIEALEASWLRRAPQDGEGILWRRILSALSRWLGLRAAAPVQCGVTLTLRITRGRDGCPEVDIVEAPTPLLPERRRGV